MLFPVFETAFLALISKSISLPCVVPLDHFLIDDCCSDQNRFLCHCSVSGVGREGMCEAYLLK